MAQAEVNVPAIEQITGGSGAMTVQFFPDYLANDFKPGGVFVQNQGSPLPVAFNGQQSGGVSTPNMQVSGLSLAIGANRSYKQMFWGHKFPAVLPQNHFGQSPSCGQRAKPCKRRSARPSPRGKGPDSLPC
jgi:hypothetical protein